MITGLDVLLAQELFEFAVECQRAALIGATRRRFIVEVADIVDVAAGTIPTHRVIDAEHGLDASMLLARIEVDLEQDATQMEYFG